jgi:hypothetical protein
MMIKRAVPVLYFVDTVVLVELGGREIVLMPRTLGNRFELSATIRELSNYVRLLSNENFSFNLRRTSPQCQAWSVSILSVISH